MKLNKGEWSEFYVFIKILFEKNIPLINEFLESTNQNLLVKKIIDSSNMQYILNNEDVVISGIDSNDNKIIGYEELKQKINLDKIFNKILESNKTFEINEFNIVKNEFGFSISKASSFKKSDITLEVQNDTLIKDAIIEGYSIKSKLGSPATILNASRATNFIFILNDFQGKQDEINQIKTKSKIKDRLSKIQSCSSIIFSKIYNETFQENLKLIDSQMDEFLSVIVLKFYSSKINSIKDLVENLDEDYILKTFNIDKQNFEIKIKRFLVAICLGMFPTKKWNSYNSSSGFIIVKKNGDIGCLHYMNPESFENYLYENTKLDTPSSSRHDFGSIYKDNRRYYFNLNLQVRFK